MEKIQMPVPLVEMDGDEMTRIIWQEIKKELLEEIISVFEEKRIPVEVHNTICDATKNDSRRAVNCQKL